MYNGCIWLPEPLQLKKLLNDDLEEFLYKFFINELLNGNIVYKDKPVRFRSNPKIYGKEEGFFHIISGYRCKPIIEDRARRLLWGKYIINNIPCSKVNIDKCCEGIWVWKSDKNDAKTERINIYHPKVNYLVVLEERDQYWLYITSYRIDGSNKRSELKLEYKRNKCS